MKTYIVAGLGRFGRAVALKLQELGNEVLVIDKNNELIQQVASHVTYAVVGDATDVDVLRSLGVRNYDCAIVATTSSLSDSILITLNFKELGVPQVVCKAQDESHKKILLKMGADQVIIPEREMGDKIAKGLSSVNLLEFIELSPEYGIVEFPTPPAWVGKTLKDLNVRARFGVNIIGLRAGGKINAVPKADQQLDETDLIVAMGAYEALAKLPRS